MVSFWGLGTSLNRKAIVPIKSKSKVKAIKISGLSLIELSVSLALSGRDGNLRRSFGLPFFKAMWIYYM